MSTSAKLGLVFSYDGELLHGAAIYDQVTLLEDLLNNGGNGTVKSRDQLGRTPLHTAASHGSVNCVRLLLQRGADPNANSGIEDDCSTPVHHAAKNGHLACLAALLEYEVNLDLKNSKGKRALEVALEEDRSESTKCANYIKKVRELRQKEVEQAKCEELYDVIDDGKYERARQILESMANPYSVVNKYYRGPSTLLYRASIGGFVDLVNLLINYKADGRPNADSGITPLYAAAFAGHLEVVKVLTNTFPKHLVMPVTVDETYPLHAAIMKGRIHIVRYLLTFRGHDQEKTKDLSRKISQQESSPSKYKTKLRRNTTSDLSSVDEENKYFVNINQPMKSGYTPLHLAVMYGSVEIIDCLLQCTPLVTERMVTDKSCSSLIVDRLANKMTPFHHALLLDKVNIAERLLKHGVDINQIFNEEDIQSTPLQYACRNSSEEMVNMLLSHGAQDYDSLARIEAVNSKKENIIQILLNNGAFPDEEGRVVCAASEISYELKPVIIQWEGYSLDILKEDWLLTAGLSCNTTMYEKLSNDPSLRIKLFTSINLSHNKLVSLPMILFQMPSLKKLNLSYNQIKILPGPTNESVSQNTMTNDEIDASLTLSHNWNCPSLEELDLQHNLLENVPKYAFTMPSLKTVHLSFNEIETMPFEMWIAPSLKNLFLEHNNLKWLPEYVGGGIKAGGKSTSSKGKNRALTEPVRKIEEHFEYNNKGFSAVSQIYSKRPAWNDVETDDEDEEEVEFLKKSGLNKLDISDNKLAYIPIGLSCLAPNLTKLTLRKNKITEVTSIASIPEHITSLDLSDNSLKVFNLSTVNEDVAGACYAIVQKQTVHRINSYSAKKRYCQHCKHRHLAELTRLLLNHNQLDNLPLLSQHTDPSKQRVLFPSLKTLNLAENKLTCIPQGIGKLVKLGSLYLGHNLSIDSLPYELGLCSELYELKLESLQLKDPPKTVLEKQLVDGRRDVRLLIGYLKSLHDKAEVYPNIKLMLVGIHGIGKTTLLELLRKEGTGPYQQPDHRGHFSERQAENVSMRSSHGNRSTVGVEVCEWWYAKRAKDLKIKFSTWDFAGQTEYYATHQCFLSRRALYLVLWRIPDGLKGIEEIEQWLLNIQARAPNSAVIIIGTFLDEIDRKQKNYVNNMHQEILKRFTSIKNGGEVVNLIEKGLPNVIDVIEVSCKNGTNIQQLRDLIYTTVINMKVDGKEGSIAFLLDKPIPASYIAVEKAVLAISKKLKNNMPVLEREQFRQQVNEQLQIQGSVLRNGTEELDQAVRFLHDNGTLLHYDDPSLSNLYFVDPQWLCDLLAHVVTVRNVNPCIKNGVLKISDLQNQIFKGENRFPSSMVMKYVELMSKFEVAIKISDKFLLIPSLLPEKQKECPVVADHESAELRQAMNIQAYMHHRVYRRQYLMSYVPSGFWARLLTRLIADDRVCKIVSSCYEIIGSGASDSEQAKHDAETLLRAAPPEWACWKTGIELSCFGTKLLRVCQLEKDIPFYGAKKTKTGVFVKNQTNKVEKTAVEILAPSLTLTIEKFIQYKPSEDDQSDNLVGFRVVGVNNRSSRPAAQLLVITIEHIDNLFAEWFPTIDSYTNVHGSKAVCRISFCDHCLNEEITKQNFVDLNVSNLQDNTVSETIRGNSVLAHESEIRVYQPENIHRKSIPDMSQDDDGHRNTSSGSGLGLECLPTTLTATVDTQDKPAYHDEEDWQILDEIRQLAKDCIMAFEVQECTKLLRDNKPLVCPFHYRLDYNRTFPDLIYQDLAENLILTPEDIRQGTFLASGAYGDVFRADINSGGTWISAAMKIPFNSDKDKSKAAVMATMFSYDTYKNVRQELAILVPVSHPNIVSFLGIAVSPFALLLELAPGGSLDKKYMEYRNVAKRISPHVIQKTLIQISAALKYLHRHHIIYRDLKCENVLVWSFPGPAVIDPENAHVLVKLTDYGISRPVSLSGIKGYLGTPGFMAPEIIRYTGKESYTVKVDCFSFGSLLYEMIAQQQPFSDIVHNKASLAQQYMLEGRRPRLAYKEKRYPVLMISLLYRCWAQNPDDRPSMADINGLVSLDEFPKLLDILGLGESFNLQCVVTTNHGQIKQNVVDSRSVIGSHLWFCGYVGFGDNVSAQKEGSITVFSYHDSKYTHNIGIRDRISMVCSVGSTVWLGTESGIIQVFCALAFKPLAIGRLICHRHILRILHSPVTHSVLITRSDGCVYAYRDNISSYAQDFPPNEVQSYFPSALPGQIVRELIPYKEYAGDTKIHCFAAVSSRVQRRYSREVMTYRDSGGVGIAVAMRDAFDNINIASPSLHSTELSYELWCGQERGLISILDLNSLKKMKTIPVKGDDITNPILKDLHVTFMETAREFDSFVQRKECDAEPSSECLWMVAYPGTEVLRWNVNSRTVEGIFDASQHSPWRELNSLKLSKKTKSLRAYDAQISSLAIVEKNMYVGTTFGCLIICDSISMVPILSLRCCEELIDTIIPLRMITSRNRQEKEKKLVITCGRKCLDFWIRNVNRKKRIVSKEMTILTWNNEKM